MTENFSKDNNFGIHNASGKKYTIALNKEYTTFALNHELDRKKGHLQAVKVIQNTGNSPFKTSLTTIKVPITEIQNKIKTLKAVKVNVNCASDSNSKLLTCSVVKREPIDPAELEDSIHLELSKNNQLDELDLIEILDSRTAAELCTSLAGRAVCNFRSRVTSGNRPIPKVMSYRPRKRSTGDEPQQEYTTKRRRHADKVGKGLRHFSMKVCEKVRNKGFTSYNEVADELVTEFTSGIHGSTDSQHYDQKNIRRRVYDALNVLMAMNIISKEKKEIRWLGLPTNSVQECSTLEREKQNRIERINKKTQQLEELLLQHISFKSLIERNKDSENRGVKPSPSSAIHLPFIVVNTTDKALIDCSISNDKTEYMFNFNKKFQIHDDIDILKRMGLLHGLDQGECTEENIRRIKTMVPKSLEHYVEMMGRGNSLYFPDEVEDSEQEDEEDSEQQLLEEPFKVEIDAGDDDDINESSEEGSDVDV